MLFSSVNRICHMLLLDKRYFQNLTFLAILLDLAVSIKRLCDEFSFYFCNRA